MNTRKAKGSEDDSKRTALRRRRYLVDRRRQLSSTLRVAGLILVLLVLLNGVLAWQNYVETAKVLATHPEIGEQMREADLRHAAVTAAISLIIVAMVVVRSIMITHRTAGAVFSVSRHLDRIATGHYDGTLRLRTDDTIRAIEDPFNKMVGNLRRRAEQQYRSLSNIAKELEEHGNPVDAEMVRWFADSNKRLLD
jgi:methyl-accepting chemotaxis protein